MSENNKNNKQLFRKEIHVDFLQLMKVMIHTYEILSSRQKEDCTIPLMPQEVAILLKLRDFINEVDKSALKSCWDGKAFCRYPSSKEGVCCLSREELQNKLYMIKSCKWRGKAWDRKST